MLGFLKKLFGKGDEGPPPAPAGQGPNPGVPGAVDQVSAVQTANAPAPSPAQPEVPQPAPATPANPTTTQGGTS